MNSSIERGFIRKSKKHISFVSKLSTRNCLRNSKIVIFYMLEIKRNNKFYKKRLFVDPLFKKPTRIKKRILLETSGNNFPIQSEKCFETGTNENEDETTPTFLHKKRQKQKIKLTQNHKTILVNNLKAYKQDEVSFYNITDLLELFKNFTGINYENYQLKVK